MARKILLADDSVTAQNMGRKILTDAGYDVITVNNGSAALKRVGEQKPDLIVLDVYMPGYSGLEVCVRLKDAPETARIPILLTVGKLEPFKPEEAARVRADAFIVKPFEASELLSALTRLEDRMVPQADGTRFSSTMSGIERFNSDPSMRAPAAEEEDSGWKTRLRFPAKKKKEEPEPAPEEDFGTTPFRDFKKGKGAAAKAAASQGATPAAQEPGLVPDIPRDITPEELDALSELVAKLDGPIPASEHATPLGDKIAAAEPTAEAKAEEAPAAEAKAEVAPAAEAAPAETAPVAAETTSETPAAATETVTETAPAAMEEEATPAEVPAAIGETEAAPAGESTAASESTLPEMAASAAAEAPYQEAKEFAVVASPESNAGAEPEQAESAAVEEAARSEAREAIEAPKVEAAAEEAPVEASPAAAAEPESPAPSAEDLAEALRLLTPSHAGGQSLAEAGAALAEELARGPAQGPRWVAEAVALSPEEASASLEEEMFRTFATQPGTTETTAEMAATASATVRHEEEEAAEAAVEAAEAVTESAEASAQITPIEAAEEPPAEIVAAGATVSESETAQPVAAEESVQEEAAGVTFADAVRSEEAESVSSEEEPGGSEDMAKDAKGKSKWHQIHETPEATAKTDVVEAAKQSEEAPKAMAAAAAEGGEASAIASIVDSVLADLKPKIVEEIAKKLAKK